MSKDRCFIKEGQDSWWCESDELVWRITEIYRYALFLHIIFIKTDSKWIVHTVEWPSCLLKQLLLISPSDVDWIWALHAWIPERLNYQLFFSFRDMWFYHGKVIRYQVILITFKIIYVYKQLHGIKRSSSSSYFWKIFELSWIILKLVPPPLPHFVQCGDFLCSLHGQTWLQKE